MPKRAQFLDVVRIDLPGVRVELLREAQQSLVGHGNVRVEVVDGDLLGLGPAEVEPADDLAVGRHAVGAHVRRRAHQETYSFWRRSTPPSWTRIPPIRLTSASIRSGRRVWARKKFGRKPNACRMLSKGGEVFSLIPPPLTWLIVAPTIRSAPEPENPLRDLSSRGSFAAAGPSNYTESGKFLPASIRGVVTCRGALTGRRSPTRPQARPPASSPEAPLLERRPGGDEVAGETLVRDDTARLLAVARRYMRNEEDARDAVQEAFIAAFRRSAGSRADPASRPGSTGSRSTAA